MCAPTRTRPCSTAGTPRARAHTLMSRRSCCGSMTGACRCRPLYSDTAHVPACGAHQPRQRHTPQLAPHPAVGQGAAARCRCERKGGSAKGVGGHNRSAGAAKRVGRMANEQVAGTDRGGQHKLGHVLVVFDRDVACHQRQRRAPRACQRQPPARATLHATARPAAATRANAGAAHTHTHMHTHAHTHSARTHRDTRCTQRARRTTTKGPLGQLPVRGSRLRAVSRGVGRRALMPFSFLAARGHGPLFLPPERERHVRLLTHTPGARSSVVGEH